ncbi:TonB family protein [Persicimonas caeni]|uniref:TonB family protein n=1 Tax=Persicimonas caeni TaxID=2292766 RepID=A0A4Y6Q1U0_PERCE|nr:TonB family protein [Persicimonas caeni]QDG54502.1 TonB family protein [Persicimonas caeni]QED35723.1 TonB family protein [Persicimonas caeni]
MPADERHTDAQPFRLPRQRSARKSVLWAIALSIAVHIPILLSFPNLLDTDDALEPTEFDATREFELTVVDEPEEKPERVEDELDGQFVSQKPPEKQERPDEAKFLDQYDSKVEEETARKPGRDEKIISNTGSETSGLPSRPEPTHRPERMQEITPPQPEPEEAPEQEVAEEASEEPSEEAAEQEAADQAVELDEVESVAEGVVQQEDSKRSKPNPKSLFPSMENVPVGQLGGGSIDYLRDVKDGEKTLLNRKKSRYWSFMHRFKMAVLEQWKGGEVYRQRDPYGKVYGVKDRYSVLGIALNGDGSLRKIHVERPSGLDFWDEEAVRAIREAAPFPNPPEGLKDRDGIIHIRFGFLLDINTGEMRGLRIFR